MFTRLSELTFTRRRLVLVVTVVAVALAAAVGSGVFGRLSGGGFDDPDAEAIRAAEVLDERFDAGSPDLVLLVDAAGGDVDADAVAAAGVALTEEVGGLDGVGRAISYWTAGRPPSLRSGTGDGALVLVRLDGDEDAQDASAEHVAEVVERANADADGLIDVGVGGPTQVFTEVSETIEGDLARAESIAVPITLVLLVVVFGGLVAALLPLAVGMVAVFGGFAVLVGVTMFTDVSVFSINLITAMGLGLAIDYSLFIVNRFREELDAGHEVRDAISRTVRTAGRTVAFSGVTVAVSLAALLVFPLYFLRSFAWAGIGVVAVAVLTSTVALPALLAVLGHRVDRLRIGHRRPVVSADGFWSRTAHAVMARPWPFALGVTLVLVVAGLPFFGVQWGLPDDRVLPEDAPARVVSDELRADFDAGEQDAFGVALLGPGAATDAADGLAAYAALVSRVDGVARVDSAVGHHAGGELVAGPDATTLRFPAEGDTWISVVASVEDISPEAEAMIADIRSIDAPYDEALVGGTSAELVDSKAAIFGLVPWAALLIAASTFVLLFLMFGSVVVPAKAIVLNLLSLTATFGAIVWVFQEGHGAGLLDFTPTGLTDTSMPILMFCIAFGLSMDYEVFLLSRIKEEYDRTGDNTASVATGLQRTGRLVTAAAALLSVTFIAFGTSEITFIKMFGVGLAMAILVDASLVRALLVPAFMRLAGDANWWAPAALRRLHDRIGISEHVELDDPAAADRDPADDDRPSVPA
ncbi:MAG: MMPL family transporter [Actinomycetota bacterium]|nr:MMPL family transporter [Actinomycetota bacterium]